MNIYRLWPTGFGLLKEMILVLDPNVGGKVGILPPLKILGVFEQSVLRFMRVENEAKSVEEIVMRTMAAMSGELVRLYDVYFDEDDINAEMPEADYTAGTTAGTYVYHLVERQPDQIRGKGELAATMAATGDVIWEEE